MTLPDFKAGSTFAVVVAVAIDGVAVDLTGATITCELRKDADGSLVQAVTATGNDPDVGSITLLEGNVVLTEAWPKEVLRIDVRVQQAGGNVFFTPTATFQCRRPETRS